MAFTDEELKEYLIAFFKNNDQFPPIAITADRFGVTHHPISERFRKFEKEGFLQRNVIGNYMFSRG